MEFWKEALKVAGIGVVGFYVFHSLYKSWLTLPIFSQLTQAQTYYLQLFFLLLVFAALIASLITWLRGRKPLSGKEEEAALYRLEQAWNGVSYIDCDNLIGPDVVLAGNALQMTATYWCNGFISKPILIEQYGNTFTDLFDQLDSCDKQIPGYNKPKKYCKDLLTPFIRTACKQIRLANPGK